MGVPSLVSVDDLWLNLALKYGIPGVVFIALSMISTAIGSAVNLRQDEAKLARILSIIIVVVILCGFTVDIWEAPWIFVALLLGVRAHLTELGSQPSPITNAPEELLTLRPSFIQRRLEGRVG